MRIDYPMYMASLAPTPTERDPILDKHLEDYMAISDEAEITDFELLQLMDNISHYNQIPEDRRSFPPAYFVEGPLPRLAMILRLRMLQDKQLQNRLQQAKLVASALELQADSCKERLDSALAHWEEEACKPSYSSITSSHLPSFYPVKLITPQTYRLPSSTFTIRHTGSSA